MNPAIQHQSPARRLVLPLHPSARDVRASRVESTLAVAVGLLLAGGLLGWGLVQFDRVVADAIHAPLAAVVGR